MARGDTPHLDGEPDGGPANQREILAQFEAAIAGMRTRDIQIGLRQLLAATVPPPHSPGSREADGAGPAADSAARPFSTIGQQAEVPAPVAELGPCDQDRQRAAADAAAGR